MMGKDGASDAFSPIATFIHGLRFRDLPPDVVRMGRRCLVDLLGIWAAGIATRPSRLTRDHAVRRHGGGPDVLPMPFDGRAVDPVGYAFAGAATIDAVDGHDGHELCKGHAGAAVLPALMAELGEKPSCSLDDFLTHLVLGYEIAIRAGLSLHATAPDYHSSGAWNALGCAAVAARIRRFSFEQTRHALGIAEYFGPRAPMMRCIAHPTMVKDSTSWGAMTGVSAADLAESGFTGAPAITCEGADVASFWQDLGRRWRILETNFKVYPVCRWSHPAIEAALALTRDQDIQPGQIEAIDIATFHEAACLATFHPEDGDQAQYSLPLAVAIAFAQGPIAPDHVLPEAYDRPEIRRLVDRVRLVEKTAYSEAFPEERYADITVTLSDGQHLSATRMTARGTVDAPLTDAEILAKFDRYAAGALSQAKRDAIGGIVATPDKAPSPVDLSRLLRPETRIAT